MNARTINDLLFGGVLAGALTIVSGDLVHKVPEMPAKVTRLYEIESLMTKPRYSLQDMAEKDSIEIYAAKNERDNLTREGLNLIFKDHVRLEERDYDEAMQLVGRNKRVQMIAGTVIILPFGLGMVYRAARSRRKEDGESPPQ